ncbi:hypothetical protein [Nonomuraea sp. NPDC048826]|uniref:hypothetical protein n=1 Tax=Nonomuraea sp. NPDC048826 TaxID=3364347 RepID=UPI0037240D82
MGKALAYHGLGRADLLRILTDLLTDPDVEIESYQTAPTHTLSVVARHFPGDGTVDEVRVFLPARLLG